MNSGSVLVISPIRISVNSFLVHILLLQTDYCSFHSSSFYHLYVMNIHALYLRVSSQYYVFPFILDFHLYGVKLVNFYKSLYDFRQNCHLDIGSRSGESNRLTRENNAEMVCET
jgi:hypothetical protein